MSEVNVATRVKSPRKLGWFCLSVCVVLLDQITKHWAMMVLVPYQPKPVIPMLNLTLAYNTGSAFGFLHQAGAWHDWFFLSFGTLMSCVFLLWMVRMKPQTWLPLCAVGLMLGGAVGNLIDRINHHHVIDFIDVYYKSYHFPIFNLADSAICVGAFLLYFAWDDHR